MEGRQLKLLELNNLPMSRVQILQNRAKPRTFIASVLNSGFLYKKHSCIFYILTTVVKFNAILINTFTQHFVNKVSYIQFTSVLAFLTAIDHLSITIIK